MYWRSKVNHVILLKGLKITEKQMKVCRLISIDHQWVCTQHAVHWHAESVDRHYGMCTEFSVTRTWYVDTILIDATLLSMMIRRLPLPAAISHVSEHRQLQWATIRESCELYIGFSLISFRWHRCMAHDMISSPWVIGIATRIRPAYQYIVGVTQKSSPS